MPGDDEVFSLGICGGGGGGGKGDDEAGTSAVVGRGAIGISIAAFFFRV
jgi:hypothetical protein